MDYFGGGEGEVPRDRGLDAPVGLRLARRAARIRVELPFALGDAAVVAVAYGGMLLARYEGSVPSDHWSGFGRFLALAIPVHIGAGWAWRLYGQIWRHASIQEARRIASATLTATAILLGAMVLFDRRPVPLSVVLAGGVLTILGVGASRFQSRLFAFQRSGPAGNGLRVVVIGAGSAGATIIREMLRPNSGYLPVAIVDDDPSLRGRAMHGIPVAGRIDDIGAVAAEVDAQQALLAIAAEDDHVRRRAIEHAERASLPLKVLPTVGELVNGRVTLGDIRDIEIEDVLGRRQIETDLVAVAQLLHRKRVLITGAGGSIGAEIARQVARLQPAELILLDHDETHLHDVAADLPPSVRLVLADIRDADRVLDVFHRWEPEVVFHAAAHKHVPLLEDHPSEAVRTNVLGTRNVVDAARTTNVARFVLISTDKAVHPCNVMGATKAVAERIVLAGSPPGSRYCAVRFGNVLGSRGSVIPTFTKQILAGGPVTVTDSRMTRYFMSIPEAVQLVLQAGALSDRGGEIFMLEMGEPIRILDLAERMIRLSGRQIGRDIEIRITGTRPGEKINEELHAPDEVPHPTPHPAVRRLELPAVDVDDLADGVAHLDHLVARRDDPMVGALLFDIVGTTPSIIDLRTPRPFDLLAAELSALDEQ